MSAKTRTACLRLFGAALLAGLAAISAVEARGYMTAGFLGKKSRPLTLALLPPHAEVIKEKVVMTDDMPQEAAALEREAARAMKAGLEEKGYRVRIVTPEEVAKSAGLRVLVKKVNDRYNEEWGKILWHPKKIREHRYQGGGDVLQLCGLLKVQGVALVRIQAVGVSKGKATLRYFAGSNAPHSYARIDLGVLEGKQGFVEAYFNGVEGTSLGQILKKPALVMGQATGHALRKYPGSDEVRAVEEVAQSKGDDDGPADESVVKDFEVLVGSPPKADK